jgi:MFS superfamily sulfate permease-like transporter
MSVAIGLYVYLVLGIIIAMAIDRHFMREEVPYGFAPAVLPLATMRIGTIIGLTILWPAVVYCAVVGLLKLIRTVRRARRIYGHRS